MSKIKNVANKLNGAEYCVPTIMHYMMYHKKNSDTMYSNKTFVLS